ncbi:MAG: class I SAM-dependent methyltransferase [Velocimicrobium sp.]
MGNKLTFTELICGTHLGLERQGPGSSEMTIKALSFLDALCDNPRIVDLGCGTGGQTMTLAQNSNGNITGIDQFSEFIEVLNNNANKLNLGNRVSGIVGDMLNLPFGKEEIDVIWCEGAIDSIGFEKGFVYWNEFIKKDGYVVVTCPSWLTDEHPTEIQKFWRDAGSGLDTIGNNVGIMQKAGFIPVAVFTLPERCWTDYFIPREEAGKVLLERHTGNEDVKAFIQNDKHEVELYLRCKQYYGYVFYIGKKI